MPLESVTVRWIRYQTSCSGWPVVGTVKDPDVEPPRAGTNGWM